MRKSIAVLITFFMMMSLCACSLSDVKDLIVPGQSTKTQSVILEPGQKDATKNKPIDADDDEKDDTDPKNSRSKSKGTSIQNIFTAENEMTEVMTYLRDSKGTDISQLKWFRFYQVIIDDYQVFTIVQYRRKSKCKSIWS